MKGQAERFADVKSQICLKSPMATNNIAQRESLGFDNETFSDAEGVEQIYDDCCSPSASDVLFDNFPSDSRWAILFVIFDD